MIRFTNAEVSDWGNPDCQGLIEKALHGMNFVCKNDFPSLDFIKQNFDADQLRDNNFLLTRRYTVATQVVWWP